MAEEIEARCEPVYDSSLSLSPKMTMWQTLAVVILARVIIVRLVRYLVSNYVPKKEKIPVDVAAVEQLNKRWETAIQGLGTTGKTYLVVGAGFLGGRIIKALLVRGETNVRAFDITIPDALKAQFPQVKWLQGDVNDMAAITAACRGVDVVYSTFAAIRYWESMAYQLPISMRVNVDGTNSVVEACIQESVKVLISTSTSNVTVPNIDEPQVFNEDTPYVNNTNAPHHYAYTKALAEQLVLQAHGKPLANGERLKAAAIRPCSGIFGSRDRFLLQRLVERGSYEIVVEAKIDFVYVDNVAYAHLLLENALQTKPDEQAGGAPFCVSNNDPLTLVDLIGIAREFRPDLTIRRLPRWLMFGMADLLDMGRRLLGPRMPNMGELQMLTRTSFVAAGLNYVVKSDRAQRVLGYRPIFSVREAVQLSLAGLTAVPAGPSTASLQT